jgi:hypothetical protein
MLGPESVFSFVAQAQSICSAVPRAAVYQSGDSSGELPHAYGWLARTQAWAPIWTASHGLPSGGV